MDWAVHSPQTLQMAVFGRSQCKILFALAACSQPFIRAVLRKCLDFFRQGVLFWAAVDPEEIIIGEFILEKRFRGRASAVAHPPATNSEKSVHILIPSILLRLFSMQVPLPFFCIFNE